MTLTHDDYTVAWICALPLEMAAAKIMLDEVHPSLPQPKSDHNVYTLGRISGHNVVVACLPSGVYGTISASAVVTHVVSTFPNIRFGLMVGIGGGAPSKHADIRLGDIVVSKPTAIASGVVQYDYGKLLNNGRFQHTGSLNKPPPILLKAMSQVESDHMTGKNHLSAVLAEILQNEDMKEQFSQPQVDWLFHNTYDHVGEEPNCSKCDQNQLVDRPERTTEQPYIHYGLIASGDQVMKDAITRDLISRDLDVLCFEMEAAGLMDEIPTLVIRGICDYCDTHKQKEWQGYAALTAAAYTKELLSVVPKTSRKIQQEQDISASLATPGDLYSSVMTESVGEEVQEFTKVGNLDLVRSLIDRGLAAPTDVNSSWGVPILSYAVQGLHTNLCRFLVERGADPCIENRSNISALDRAWDIFLSRSAKNDIVNELRSIFSLWYDSVWFEEQQFTSLHKIVLGAVERDIEDELDLSTSNINVKDSKGRTPIAWAAARGDVCSVKLLLRFGADPNISCDTGNNPLLRSVRAKSSECVRLLLEHGANARSKSTLGFTALHYAAYYRDDETYIEPLLEYDAPVEEKDDYGWTPLSCTAEYDHDRSARALLDYGANIESRDKLGWTPLLRAVNSNSHKVCRLLLEKGANYHAMTFRSETILHLAAARGDIETISILAATTLNGLNADTKNLDGKTAADIMSSRAPVDPDVAVTLSNLLNGLRNFLFK
ncbi:hypothetical protein ANOM_000252 [Aspergillus nomiae NRRL 13137]|uniref:Nucleoside phosphorylase domain-containing protein n=1 Tax=Aspergillus nomiae NRRL (strain ATCC 15546 / NRRL 13137 / CBS 260.88 / M93) TaxID=1509407 RepID=A0A0L1JIV8_ASPN3|nr:uncharacterized protein ANOM_000252 [Aspergillus nomiae NRRL 13137]KNG91704.1 hypothetical protein ANOM_000252 [Aspergillus nomiae NRRL 13137]